MNTKNPRALLLDAAKEIIIESGYAAVSSRRVAEKAGIKPSLVHYYFETMDDMFVTLFQEVASDIKNKLNATLKSSTPLADMWELLSDPRNVLMSELIALASHKKVIQKEIAESGNRFRLNQIQILSVILEKKGFKTTPWMLIFITIAFNSLARSQAAELAVGIKEGHAEASAIISRFIVEFDKAEDINQFFQVMNKWKDKESFRI